MRVSDADTRPRTRRRRDRRGTTADHGGDRRSPRSAWSAGISTGSGSWSRRQVRAAAPTPPRARSGGRQRRTASGRTASGVRRERPPQPAASLPGDACPPTIPTSPTRNGAAVSARVFSSGSQHAHGVRVRPATVSSTTRPARPSPRRLSGAAATTIADSIESAPASHAQRHVLAISLDRTDHQATSCSRRDGNGSNLGAVVIEQHRRVNQSRRTELTIALQAAQPPAVMHGVRRPLAPAQRAWAAHGPPVQPAHVDGLEPAQATRSGVAARRRRGDPHRAPT